MDNLTWFSATPLPNLQMMKLESHRGKVVIQETSLVPRTIKALMGRCQTRATLGWKQGAEGRRQDERKGEKRTKEINKGWKTGGEKGSPGKEREEDKSEGEAWTDRVTRKGWRKGSRSRREAPAHAKDGVFTTQPCENWSCWPSGSFFISLSPLTPCIQPVEPEGCVPLLQSPGEPGLCSLSLLPFRVQTAFQKPPLKCAACTWVESPGQSSSAYLLLLQEGLSLILGHYVGLLLLTLQQT